MIKKKEGPLPEITCTTAKKKRNLFLLIMGCFFLILLILVVLMVRKKQKMDAEFIPPKFEPNAQNFNGDDVKVKGYSVLNAAEGYQVGICGELVENDGEAEVCFVNPPENKVWIQLRILDQNGEQIAKSGVLKQGQWLEKLKLQRPLSQKKTTITMEVRGYEPKTYYSAGKLSLKTFICQK